MISQTLTLNEQHQWTEYFWSHLADRLQWAKLYVSAHKQKMSHLKPYGDSLFSLIRQGWQNPELSQLIVDLILVLHPLPERWGYWESWAEVLQVGARIAVNPCQQAELLAYLSHLLWSCNRWSEAEDVGRGALQKAAHLQEIFPLGIGGSALIKSLCSSGRQEEAEQLLTYLLDKTADLGHYHPEHHTVSALIYLKQSQALLLRLQGRQAEAIIIARQMLQLARENPDISPYQLGDTYVEQATMLWAGGDYKAAVQALQEAIHLFERTGDKVASVFANGSLGLVYWSMAQFERAEQCVKQCIFFCEQFNIRWRVISQVGNLAVVYLGQGQLIEALHCAENHLELAQRYGHHWEAGRARLNRGAILTYLGSYELALTSLNLSLEQVRAEGRQELIAAVLIDLSLCYDGLNQPEMAVQYAWNAYEMAVQMTFPGLRIISLRTLARYGQISERVAWLQTALQLAQKHQRRFDEAGCLFSLVNLVTDESQRINCWHRAVQLLVEIGATAWLANHSLQCPPFTALML